MAASGKNSGNSRKQSKKDKYCEKSLISDGDVLTVDISMHNCCICEEEICSNVVYLKCKTCHKYMHGPCWDPDAPAQVCEYLSKVSSNAGVHVYCQHCVVLSNTDVLSSINERIRKLEEHLSSTLRDFKDHSREKSYASYVAGEATVSPPSSLTPPSMQLKITASTGIQNEIAEAMDQERRKQNIVVFHMQSAPNGDTNRLTALFEHLTGTRPPSFRSCRLANLLLASCNLYSSSSLVNSTASRVSVLLISSKTSKQNGLMLALHRTGRSNNKGNNVNNVARVPRALIHLSLSSILSVCLLTIKHCR
jgi:hypothetical protein